MIYIKVKVNGDALNSYDVPVKIDINTVAARIEIIDAQPAETRKFVKDGQLFIRRGEHIYSVLGNVVE